MKQKDNQEKKYEKSVNRAASLFLLLMVVFVIVLVWVGTSVFYKNQTIEVVNIVKPNRIETSKIYDAKLVKNYDDFEGIDNFDYIELGRYNGKKIEWIVLDAKNGEALIVSKYVLRAMQFTDKEKKFWQNWWSISDVKGWLENEFYAECFSESEKSEILGKGFFKTKITILDNKEIEKYFGVSETHKKTKLFPGIDDSNIEVQEGYVPYWTKTDKKNRISAVKSDGELNSDGYKPTNKTIGIRPALYIKY